MNIFFCCVPQLHGHTNKDVDSVMNQLLCIIRGEGEEKRCKEATNVGFIKTELAFLVHEMIPSKVTVKEVTSQEVEEAMKLVGEYQGDFIWISYKLVYQVPS